MGGTVKWIPLPGRTIPSLLTWTPAARKEFPGFMEWNAQKVLVNVHKADSDDLLDRVTVYRAGMEPEALAMIEGELHRRGVTSAQIDAYRQECERQCLYHNDGTAKMCSLCRRPAVQEGWGWHRLMGKIPIVPRWMRYCKDHARKKPAPEA